MSVFGILKRLLQGLVLAAVAAVLVYSLPSYDVVRITGTEVKRMDLADWNWWWAEPDAGTEAVATRDVRFINAVYPDGRGRVYRNEDTNWGFPPYLKFDSGTLAAEAQSMESTKADPQWVVITHYGFRFELLSMFPNAMEVRPATGPGEFVIPWFNIAFILGLLVLGYLVWRFVGRLKTRHFDPVVDDVGDAFGSVSRSAGSGYDAARGRAGGLWTRFDRWLDTWRPRERKKYRRR